MKYNLGQVIFYMKDNRVHSAEVLSRKQVENIKEDISFNVDQYKLYTAFGLSGVTYSTCHGNVEEYDAFATKEELLASL